MTETAITLVPLSTYNWSLSHFGLLDPNLTVYCMLASLFAISLWLVIDLTAQLCFTFQRYRGLYFYSIILTTWGITFHAIAFLLKLYVPAVNSLAGDLGTTFLAKLGWVMNTTGFSLVLYSRLSLVVQERRVLNMALGMIIVNALLLHTPIVIFSFGLSTLNHAFWLPYMSHMERIQIVGFTLQDLTLSTFYTFTSAKLLADRPDPRRRNLFVALLFAQAFGFVADMVMVVLDYKDMFTLKASLHPFIYAVKLKIEFVVLNQLTCVVSTDGNDFVNWGFEEKGTEGQPPLTRSKRSREFGWSFISGRSRGLDKQEPIACLQCQSLVDGGGKANSSAIATEKSTSPVTLIFEKPFQDIDQVHIHTRSWNDEGLHGGSEGLDDLERQYLGKYM